MTEISKLGEFGLIDRLTKDIQIKNTSTQYGVGDDCAVLSYPNSEVLITSDMLMEGIHFDLTYTDMRTLGYKAAMVNISDIFAMNGTPRQLIVSIALGKRFTVEDLDAFYIGMREACSKWDIGAAYMGLQILEREKAVYYSQIDDYNKKVREAQAHKDEAKLKALREQRQTVEDFQPDFAGKEYLLDRQLKPEARGDIIEKLREANIKPTAMMDISDGLSSELMHICKQSQCGCRVYEKEIPIDYQTAVTAEQFNMNLTTCALNGGEDYELLFTVPIGDHEKIKNIGGIRQIGYITKENLGCMLVTRDNNEFELQAQGWNPLRDEK